MNAPPRYLRRVARRVAVDAAQGEVAILAAVDAAVAAFRLAVLLELPEVLADLGHPVVIDAAINASAHEPPF